MCNRMPRDACVTSAAGPPLAGPRVRTLAAAPYDPPREDARESCPPGEPPWEPPGSPSHQLPPATPCGLPAPLCPAPPRPELRRCSPAAHRSTAACNSAITSPPPVKVIHKARARNAGVVFEVAGTKAAGAPPAGAARGPRRPGRKKKNYVSLASLSPASSPFAAGRDHRRCFMPGRGTGGVSKYLRPYFNDYDRGGHVRRGHSRGRGGRQSWRHLALGHGRCLRRVHWAAGGGRRAGGWAKQRRRRRRRPCPPPQHSYLALSCRATAASRMRVFYECVGRRRHTGRRGG